MQTKREYAYEFIKDKIVRGEYLPGQRIVTNQVANDIGTSSIPVREALFKLQSENLVTITPHIGAVVSLVTVDKIVKVIETLAVLEGYATRLALENGSMRLGRLEELHNQMEECVKQEKWDSYSFRNREFHFAIYESCNAPPLTDTIRALWAQLDSILSTTSFTLMPDRARSSSEDHQRIVSMLARRSTRPLDIELFARQHKLKSANFLQNQGSLKE